MKPDTAEGRIKIVADILWQILLAERSVHKRSVVVGIYYRHQEESGLAPNQFHEALVALADSTNNLEVSNRTDSHEFLLYQEGVLLREPFLYQVTIKPGWRDEQRKALHNYSSTTKKKGGGNKATQLYKYKDLSVWDDDSVRYCGNLLPIKGILKGLLSELIRNAPYVSSFHNLRIVTGSSATNKSLLKYRDEIDNILTNAGISNAIRPFKGEGLYLEY